MEQLNYVEALEAQEYQQVFNTLHKSNWEEKIAIHTNFYLTKRKQKFQEIVEKDTYDLIYFDAFGFDVQPELWSETLFQKMYDVLLPYGILVTYACRGVIKRAMINAGFKVEKLQGVKTQE